MLLRPNQLTRSEGLYNHWPGIWLGGGGGQVNWGLTGYGSLE